MLYKHKKVQEMLRSILPSTASKSAREDRASSHRANRTRVRQACRQWCDELLYDDDWSSYKEADDSDLLMRLNVADKRRKGEIREMVRDRRGADKVNHFVRWAESLTADTDDVREKYYRFVSYIGGNTDLIREHAIGHFISPYDFRDEVYRPWRYYRDGVVVETVFREHFQAALEAALDLGKVDIINQAFRDCAFLRRRCVASDPCIEIERVEYKRVSHYIMKDGTRVKPWKLKNEDRINVAQTIEFDYSYNRTHHDREGCQNVLCLTAENIDKVVKLLFPRNKPAWGFKDGAYSNNRPHAKRAAYEAWKALRSEAIIAEREGDDG